MVNAIGLKQVAFDLDVSKSQLLNAFDERNNAHVHAEWIDYLVTKAPRELGDEYVASLAALRGLEVIPAKPRTPTEELQDLKDALAESLSPDIRAAILARANANKTKRSR